jgi:hypothetical protein
MYTIIILVDNITSTKKEETKKRKEFIFFLKKNLFYKEKNIYIANHDVSIDKILQNKPSNFKIKITSTNSLNLFL